jgi:hypothetical protein
MERAYWVNVFRNKSDHERSPSFDLKFKAKDAPVEKPQQKATITKHSGTIYRSSEKRPDAEANNCTGQYSYFGESNT